MAEPADDAIAYLESLVNHEISSVGISAGAVEGLGLEAISAVHDALGEPARAFRSIHITGTNGKGTVARLCEALLLGTGLRVGTYLSPEGSVNERIRIDGAPVASDTLADAVRSVRGASEAIGRTLSAFEAVTLTALVAFSDAPVDVAVIEVGLLGRFDATNVVDGEVAVITTIGGDHTDFAPGWQHQVAAEKAGIVKAGSLAVVGDLAAELVDHVRVEQPDSLVRFGSEFDCLRNDVAHGGRLVEVMTSRGARHELFVPLFGAHQGANVAVAIEAVEGLLHTPLSGAVLESGLAGVAIPGRIELVGHQPVVVLDGAHNADAATALGRALAESFAVVGRRIAVIGALAGRDPSAFLSALHGELPLDVVVAVGIEGPRGVPAEVVAESAARAGIACVTLPTVEAGVRRAMEMAEDEDLVVVTGSFRLIDAARRQLSRPRG